MLRISHRCPLWDPGALAKAFNLPWQPSRTAATLRTRRPSRMTLSERVAKGPASADSGGRAVKKSRNTPFGGMNVTEAPRQLQYELGRNKISAAERKRQTRMKPGKDKEQKTKDPMKALKMQRRLTSVSYEKRNRIKQELTSRDSFDEFDLLPSILTSISSQALGGLVDVSPTPIQRLAIPVLRGTEDGKRRKKKGKVVVEKPKEMAQFLLAAETGSGKTLAYVLPIIDAIKRAEMAEKEQEAAEEAEKEADKTRFGKTFELESPEVNEPHSSAGRPRAIILLPTAELVAQVGALVKSLSHTVKFRSAMISAAFSGTIIRNRLFSPGGIDVVISTPHLLSSITESDPNILSRVTHLVIDEADSLLDRSFSPITSAIIDRATPSLEQLILCSATIPRSLDSYLNKRYPETKRLATPNLHAIPRRVQLSVVDIEKIPYQGNRDLACAQTIWDIGKEAATDGEDLEKKIVVFVNEREKTIELANYLHSKGISANALSRDSDDRKQAETLAAFTTGKLAKDNNENKKSDKRERPEPFPFAISPSELGETPRQPARRLQNTRVLVMTDIGSRGIDTLLVKHVILYDVPHTSIDFIHRLGRVGRMGRRGRGIVLVGKNDRKDVVKEVREGMFKGQALI
ncbi:ATP-dependent RNA helicase mrh4, mitochondrial [Lecanosticta acicola]|uniref:RNA helicase n=1 Tax=Lecanosticta acicola TaxID=111012 RepID=A0AAI8YZC6_9PEZI|nr:ATP-dependent RNA helicase mrh4, mitochondrial [Lecanosticta acicola]